MAPENPYRQKLTQDQRRLLVDDVRSGLPVSRAAEKFGITPAAAWNLVNKAALHELLGSAGMPGIGGDEYLRQVGGVEGGRGVPLEPRPKQGRPPSMAASERSLIEAALAAAAALERFAHLAGATASAT